MSKGLLDEAARKLSIRELWKRRGWRGEPGKSCHFPNCTDSKKAACSIFTATTGKHVGCELLKDHKMGKTWDAPGLLAEVEGLSVKEACRILIDLAGVKSLDQTSLSKRSARKPASPPPPSPPPPPFDTGTLCPRDLSAEDVEAIACSRGVSNSAVQSVAKWDVLHAVTISPELRLPIPRGARPLDAWALHTPDWQSFRLRPFAGVFPGFSGQGSKSLTPGGASCAQPVWIGPANAPRVLIVEGEGDALAAFEIALRENAAAGLAVVCIFSSSIAIPCHCLPLFEGRRVRVAPHCSDAKKQGEIAAVRWSAQLKPWALSVQIFNLAGLSMPDGRPVGDLGDLAQCSRKSIADLKGVSAW